VKSAGIITNLREKISESFSNSKKLFFFLLGSSSAWISEANDLYKWLVKTNYSKLGNILTNCKDSFSKLKTPSEPAGPKFSMSNGWDLLSITQRKDTCRKMQSTFKSYFQVEPIGGVLSICLNSICGIFDNPIGSLIDTFNLSISAVKGDYCKLINPEMKRQVSSKWGRFEFYDQECQFFRDMNCEDPDAPKTPSYNIVYAFMKMSYNLYDGINGAIKCFESQKDIVNDIIQQFPVIENFFKSGLSIALEFAAGLTMQIFTAGIWGAIKGSYLLLRMGYILYKILNDKYDDVDFRIGQVIGVGIRAALSFALGRR
jgi:hypothetical protein